MNIKSFENFKNNSSRKNIYDIKELLIFKKDSLYLIYNQINKEPIGYISIGKTDYDCYSVYGAYSKNGYGPLLYEIAMSEVYPNGITLSDDFATSSDALSVWEKFYKRTDVSKEKITRLKKSTQEEELLKICDDNYDDCLKWVNDILYLHNHKFIYQLPKKDLEILNNLIIKGNQYLQENPDINIDYLCWDLE